MAVFPNNMLSHCNASVLRVQALVVDLVGGLKKFYTQEVSASTKQVRSRPVPSYDSKESSIKRRKSQRKHRIFKFISQQAFRKAPSRFTLADLDLWKSKEALQSPSNLGQEKPTFSSFALDPLLLQALSSQNITTPTQIQTFGIPCILANKEVLCASQTGTGKTLAYMLPLLHRLKTDEKANGINKFYSSPKAIILVPSRELVIQTNKVLKHLCGFIGLRFNISAPGTSDAEFKKIFRTPYDVLITLPSQLARHIEKKEVYARALEHVVIDEADTLLDSKSIADVKKVLSPSSVLESLKSLVLVTATITRPLQHSINELCPDIVKVLTEDLHKAPDILRQRFFPVVGAGDAKRKMCLKLLATESASRFMVFCNNKEITQALYEFLKVSLSNVLIIHGQVSLAERDQAVKLFNGPKPYVLVCTDLASRGLDLHNVNHVVLYDFPRNPIDYLHRVGRTARAGKGGKITAFIGKKDQKLFRFIKLAIFKHEAFSKT